MSLEKEMCEMIAELSKFQSAIGRVRHGLRSQPKQEQFGGLLERIHQAQANAESTIPAAIKKVHEVAQDVQVRAEEQRRKLTYLHKQIEVRQVTALDPALGAKLAEELARYVAPPLTAPTDSASEAHSEVWEEWQ